MSYFPNPRKCTHSTLKAHYNPVLMLYQMNMFVSVCDDHVFKDEMLFYRFRQDDNTFPIRHDFELVLKAYHISQRFDLIYV